MALTETIEYDKIEVVSIYKSIQVRKASVIKKDNVEIARSYERYSLSCGMLDDSDDLVDTDISAEPTEVQQNCKTVWTDDVKALWKAKLIKDKIT